MTVLKGRKLSGRAWKIALPSGNATSYKSALSASSGPVNAPVTDTFTPNAAWASGQTITLGTTMLAGSFGSPAGGTLSGNVLTPTSGSTLAASVVFTPTSAAGTSGTITAMPGAGLTNSTGALAYAINAIPATSYITSLSSASGTAGVPVTVSFTPNGTWSSAQTITLTSSGLTGGFSAGSGGSFANGVLHPTAGSNAPATVVFTPSAAGTGTFNSTPSSGLTNTSGVLGYTAAAGGAVLTDFTLVQPKPAHPMMAFNAAIGYCTPVGGIGPFRWSLSGNSNYQIDGTEARISGTGGGLGSTADTVSITCQDGRGTIVTKNVTIAKQANSSANIFCNYSTHVSAAVNSNPQLFWASGFPVQAFDANGQFNNNSLTVTDPTGHWVSFYGSVSTPNGDPSQFPPVGSYPLVCTLSNGSGTTLTLNLTIVVDPIVEPVIEFHPVTVTAATPVGTSIGNVLATTPFNTPTRSISDPSGSFKVNLTKGNVVVAQTLVAGTYPLALTVSDGGATTTTTFNVTVGAGITLSPSLMQMTVNPSLTNATSALGQTIGTPAMTGGYAGGTWAFSDPTGYNPNATLGYFACPARLTQDPSVGTITNQGPLSPALVLNADGSLGEGPFPLILTWTDGVHTCTQTFQVPVAWAPTTYYCVGQGYSTALPAGAPSGAIGLEHIANARQLCQAPHSDTKHFLVGANANSEYYTGDNGPNLGLTLQSWVGPVIFEGVAANGVTQPRGGGPMSGALANAYGGGDAYGKGWQVFGTGDAKVINWEISGVHGGGLTDGLEAIRKDGQTYGNLQVLQTYIHDCDNGVETGVCHGWIGVDQTEIANCGTSHVSSGATHNLYVGIVSGLIFTRSTSRRATLGHLLKCRAANSTVNASNFLATTGGQASCSMDFCNAGVVTVTNCNIQKDVMAQNPFTIQYCSERDFGVPGASYLDVFPWEQNSLTINGGNIDVMTMGGANYGSPAAIAYFRCQDPYGAWMPVPVANGVSMWLSPAALRTYAMVLTGNTTQDTTPAHQVVEISPATRPLPFVPTTARPFLSGTLPVMGAFRYTSQWGQTYFPNFESVQHLQGLNDYQIPDTAAAGTVVDTLNATGNPYNEINGPAGAVDPFGAGTTWSIVTSSAEFNYGSATGTALAPAGRYAIATNANGTGTLTVAQTPGATGVDYVCLRATGPSGSTAGSGASPAIADYRYAIVLTSTAPNETLSFITNTAVAGIPFTIQGGQTSDTLVALDYSLDGGVTWNACPNFNSLDYYWNFLCPGLPAGTQTVMVRDHNYPSITATGSITVTPSGSFSIATTTASASSPVSLSGSFTYPAILAFDYSLDGGSTWTAAPTTEIVGGYWSFTISALTAGRYALVVRDHVTQTNKASVSLVVSPATVLAITNNTAPAAQPFALVGTYTNLAPRSLDYSSDGGSTWTTAPLPTLVIGSGAFSFTAPALAVGNYTVIVRNTDSPSLTASAALTVSTAGTILPSSNMSFTPSTSLINAGRGQTVGTSTVTGLSGVPTWSVSAPGVTNTAVFAQDAVSSLVTVPGVASAQTYGLTLTATDGVKTCSQTFNVTVGTAPADTTIWVGQGMSSAHPGYGYETWAAAKALLVNTTATTRTVNVVANSNQNYYADDNGVATNDDTLRFPVQGPLHIVGIANGGISQPRLGGTVGSTADGNNPRFPAFLDIGDGDVWISNLEISYWLNGQGSSNTPGSGAAGIRKLPGTFGNLVIDSSNLHNNDDNIVTGAIPGTVTVTNTQFTGSGPMHSGTGYVYNVDIGQCTYLTFENNISHISSVGYDLQNAALGSTISGNAQQ